MSIPTSDPRTFGWIKPALFQSMLQAMDSVEEMEKSRNLDQRDLVSKHLHQIQGSLQMVELDAASVYAEDLEALTAGLSPNYSEDSATAVQCIKDGLTHLSRYLSSIEHQAPLSPLVLVDNINIVRDLTGKERASLYEFFNPPMEFRDDDFDGSFDFTDDKRTTVLHHLGYRFRQALLSWLQGQDQAQSLESMKTLMSYLRQLGGLDVLNQLWWVACGFIEAIQLSHIQPDAEIKTLFAELDLEINRMRDHSTEIASSPPNELIRQMLFYIGRMWKSKEEAMQPDEEKHRESVQVRKIREIFGLDQWFSYGAHAQFTAGFEDLIHSVVNLSRIITEDDIKHLENLIDKYFAEELNDTQRNELFNDLSQLRRTVIEHEMGIVQKFVEALCDATECAETQYEKLLLSGADIKIASALLMLGDLLENPSVISAEWQESFEQRIIELTKISKRDFTTKSDGIENRPQAMVELVSARNAVVSEIKRLLYEVEQHFTSTDNQQTIQLDLPSVRYGILQTAGLFGFINCPEVEELAIKTTDLLTKSIESGSFQEEVRKQFVYVIATIGVSADMIGQNAIVPIDVIRQGQQILSDLEAGQIISKETLEIPATERVTESFVDAVIPDKFLESSSKDTAVVLEEDVSDYPEVVAVTLEEEASDYPEVAAVVLEEDALDYPEVTAVVLEEEASDYLEVAAVVLEEDASDYLEVAAVVLEEEASDYPEVAAVVLEEDASDYLEVAAVVLEEEASDYPEVAAVVLEEPFFVNKQLDLLNKVRQEIATDPDNHSNLNQLAQVFKSMTEKDSDWVNKDIQNLAVIGNTFITGVIQQKLDYSNEFAGYVGRLIRQMCEIQSTPEAANIDIFEWESAGQSLLNDADIYRQEANIIEEPTTDNVNYEELLDGLGPELLEIFVKELHHYARIINDIADRTQDWQDTQNGRLVIDDECEQLSRLIHTLTGNFLSLGLTEYGNSLSGLEDLCTTEMITDNFDSLQGLSNLLQSMADNIDSANSIPDQILDEMIKVTSIIRNSGVIQKGEVTDVGNLYESALVQEQMAAQERPDDIDHDSSRLADKDDVDRINIERSQSQINEEDFAQELKQVFMDESEGLLNQIHALLTKWRDAGVDDEVIAGIRREFHTLKGSAAVTGFENISILSHSVESLLERDLNDTVFNNVDMLNLLEEVHDVLASDLGFIPGADEDQTLLLSNKIALLLNNEAIEEAVLPELDEAVLETAVFSDLPSEAATVDSKIEPQDTLYDADESKVDEFLIDSDDFTLVQEQMAAQERPDDIDHDSSRLADKDDVDRINIERSQSQINEEDFAQELKQVFMDESEGLLNQIHALLTKWRDAGVDDEVIAGIRREFHTLKGSAAVTGFENISILSHSVESLLERDLNDTVFNNVDMLNLLEEVHDVLASDLGFIPGADEDQTLLLSNKIALLLNNEAIEEAVLPELDEAVLETAVFSDLPSEAETVDSKIEPQDTLYDADESKVDEFLIDSDDFTLVQEQMAAQERPDDTGHDSSGPVDKGDVDRINIERSQSQINEEDFDQELKQMFMDESEGLLNQIHALLTKWRDAGVDDELIAEIRREFHTLKSSAAVTGFENISILSHSVESLLERDLNDTAFNNVDMLNLLEEVHDVLASDLGFIPGADEDQSLLLSNKITLLLNNEAIEEAVLPELDEAVLETAVFSDLPSEAVVVDSKIEPQDTLYDADESKVDEPLFPEDVAGDSDLRQDGISIKSPVEKLVSEESPRYVPVYDDHMSVEALPNSDDDGDVIPDYTGRFYEDFDEQLVQISALLTNWRENGFNVEILTEIQKTFRALTISATENKFENISNLSQSTESLLTRVSYDLSSDDSAMLNLLEEVYDGLVSERRSTVEGDSKHIRALSKMIRSLVENESEIKPINPELKDKDSLDAAQDMDMMPGAGLTNREIDGEVENLINQSVVNKVDEPYMSVKSQSYMNLDFAVSEMSDSADDRKTLTSVQVPSGDPADTNTMVSPASTSIPLRQNDPQQRAGRQRGQIITFQQETEEMPTWMHDYFINDTGVVLGESANLSGGTIRLENRKLTKLLNFSGELGLTRSQLRNTLQGATNELSVLRGNMKKLRVSLRELEFEADAQMRTLPERQDSDSDYDPLQLDRYSRLQTRAREVNQQLDDLSRVERRLSQRTSDIGGALSQQYHLGEQLQDGLMSTRMIAVNEYLPRIRQLLRETARRVGKNVSFSVTGDEINLDRQVMDTMVPAIEHMIRNAVFHGIEDDEARSLAGKSPVGKIIMVVAQQGTELLIDISDDGKGLDRDKIAKRAVEKGLALSHSEVTDDLLLQVIVEPGFTTAQQVTIESGRGVGMDVVLQAVRTLGGSFSLSSRIGKGTAFSFRLPVTMTISQALLAKVGAYQFAILTRSIEYVMCVKYNEVQSINGKEHVTVGESLLPLISLVDHMGETSMSTEETHRSIIVARIVDNFVAFEVDKLQDTVEIVIKNPGRQLTSIPGISGVTVLADSSIALIINLEEILNYRISQSASTHKFDEIQPIRQVDEQAITPDTVTTLNEVLVVDDSLVVRKVMQRDLEGLGLSVRTAVDGLDALEKLQTISVDIVLIDLEMPRMNGYELLLRLRQEQRFVNLPVIVITSRSSEIHRQRAMNLGANGYITKPYDIFNLEQMMKAAVTEKVTVH